ncbi:hypothetical protein BABINDRAFT_160570 [Babjeviella inositovora NRRL Y-12698]|uniref:CASTOR ACT domain-containing protein n=1 Tax=Babjeviella inositovora NRRL Y-12698 TaxID=984486 RepID=A0A1E3QW16_9ASCO|nr:uncharacterized protein BABINDRAFT_160570 [Babjeviella inositovora NRRL Y-12698]ODQ81177.1 hypothetical protein BABINDRAFT_160570 [Babjeviella inositovora NRRL Y-12698]
MNAQVQLYDTPLSILSIPREKYWLFSLGVLQLLHYVADKLGDADNAQDDSTDSESEGEDEEEGYQSDATSNSVPSINSHSRASTPAYTTDLSACNSKDSIPEPDHTEIEDPFLHVAFTPSECTIICSAALISKFFTQPLNTSVQEPACSFDTKLFQEAYLALQVVTDGLDNKRVLELTEPLSDSDISIFFLSTHFADIILIPEASKAKVVQILLSKGYDLVTSSPIPAGIKHEPVTVESDDLATKTFALFAKHGIKPLVSPRAKLLLTGARPGRQNAREVILLSAQALAAHNPSVPNSFVEYFAITKTTGSSISLLLPKSSKVRHKLGFGGKNKFIGSDVDSIIPISVDLTKLPIDSKGIVAGLAGRLLNSEAVENAVFGGDIGVFEMNYLSMGLSGVVMIPEEWLKVVSSVLV